MKHDYGTSPAFPLAFIAGGTILAGLGLYLGGRAVVRRVKGNVPETPTVPSEVPKDVLSPEHEALASRSWATAQ